MTVVAYGVDHGVDRLLNVVKGSGVRILRLRHTLNTPSNPVLVRLWRCFSLFERCFPLFFIVWRCFPLFSVVCGLFCVVFLLCGYCFAIVSPFRPWTAQPLTYIPSTTPFFRLFNGFLN